MPSYQIVIIEDNPLVREGYVTLLELESDLEVEAEVETGAEALSLLEGRSPDLVIVDVSLPDMDGLELVRQLSARQPELRTLVISGHDKFTYTDRAFEAGACGYVDKKEAATVLVDAIRQVLDGGRYPASA